MEDTEKLSLLHTHNSWSREYVQTEMTPVTPHPVTQSSGETLCSHKDLKSLSQSTGCLCYDSSGTVSVVQSDQGRYREVENLHSRLQGLLDGGSGGDCGGGDIPESRASRTHLAQPWTASG